MSFLVVLREIQETCEKRLHKSGSEKSGINSAPSFQEFSASKKRHSQIKDQPLARGGAHPSQFADDCAHHSVADHGQDDFAHRTFRDHAHAPAGRRQCGIYLLCSSDFGDVDLRAFCLRLGLSPSRAAGFLRVDAEENWPHSQAVSLEAAGVCPAYRRFVYVCLANRISILRKPGPRTAYP